MTIGICCAAMLGLIALWQTWAARNYREAALLFKQAFDLTKASEQRARQRVAVVGDALARAYRAATNHDTEGLLAALRAGAEAATTSDATPVSAAPIRPTPTKL